MNEGWSISVKAMLYYIQKHAYCFLFLPMSTKSLQQPVFQLYHISNAEDVTVRGTTITPHMLLTSSTGCATQDTLQRQDAFKIPVKFIITV